MKTVITFGLSVLLMMTTTAHSDGIFQASAYQAPSITTGSRFNDEYINKQIAHWALRQLNESLPIIDDPWANQLITTMTSQMNGQVRTQALVAVPIINSNDINAFAVPGGVIGINTGTIISAHALDEVASVMAHEIAHLSQRHYEHNQDNRKKLIALQLGGLLAAIAASSVNGDVATAAMIGSQTMTAENAAAHSREHEREADRVGMQILARAGYDARAMPRFFEHLSRQASLHQSRDVYLPSFVMSHPFTSERLSEATSRAAQYPIVSMSIRESQAQDFDKLTWRLKYLTHQVGINDLNAAIKHSDGARLALAWHWSEQGQTSRALELIDKMDRTDPLVCITQAYAHEKGGKLSVALTILQNCHAIYPERRDLRLHLADILIKSDKPADAQVLLNSLTRTAPQDIKAWQLTQLSFEKQAIHLTGERKDIATIHALRARSYVELWQGKYVAALQSNAQADKLAKAQAKARLLIALLDKDKQAIIDARDFKPS